MRRGDRAGRPEARNVVNALRVFTSTRISSPCCKYRKYIRVLSELAVRYFGFFKPSRTRRLFFHHVEKAQHALLSNPRAVTLLISIHKNHEQTHLYAMPTREYTFLSYCNSRPRGVPNLRSGVLDLGAAHFCLCLAPSARVTLLKFAALPM